MELNETPDHLLFGINYFSKAEFDCKIIPLFESKRLPIFYRFLRSLYFLHELGDLAKQIYILKNIQHYDLIYAPSSGQTEWLQYLKYHGKFDLPIISLRHHHLAKNK